MIITLNLKLQIRIWVTQVKTILMQLYDLCMKSIIFDFLFMFLFLFLAGLVASSYSLCQFCTLHYISFIFEIYIIYYFFLQLNVTDRLHISFPFLIYTTLFLAVFFGGYSFQGASTATAWANCKGYSCAFVNFIPSNCSTGYCLLHSFILIFTPCLFFYETLQWWILWCIK